MDDELKRKIAASLDLPDDAAADADVVTALENDPRARDFAQGLYAVEQALAAWPSRPRPGADWERMAADIERRLGEAPWEKVAKVRGAVAPLAWDPLGSPPLREDRDEAEPEHKAMAVSRDDKQNDDDDLEGLAALTRTSSAPTGASVPPGVIKPSLRPGPALGDDAMDESSGIVDIKQLAAIALKQSAPPPASTLAPTRDDASAPGDTAMLVSDPLPAARAEALAARSGAASAKAAVPAATASPRALEPERKKSSAVMWLLPAIAAAGIGGWYVMNQQQRGERSTDTAQAENTSRAAEPSSAGAGSAAAPPAAPAAAPAAPAEPAVLAQAVVAVAPAAIPAAEPPAAPAGAAPAQPTLGGAASAGPVVAANTPALERAGGEGGSARPRGVSAAAITRTEGSAGASTNNGTPPTSGRGSASAVVAVATPEPAPRPAAAPTPATAPTPPTAPAAGGAPRSIDELMATATGASRPGGAAPGTRPATAPTPAAELPERPAQRQISSTLSPLSGAVRACTQGATGMATVSMVIVSDGSVQTARVSGPFSPAVNSCIEGVVRRAHFPAFTRPSVPVVYPFSIQPRQPGGAE